MNITIFDEIQVNLIVGLNQIDKIGNKYKLIGKTKSKTAIINMMHNL